MNKISRGTQFKNVDQIFKVVCQSDRDKDIWLCKHPELRGYWGFPSKTILENIVSEKQEKQEKQKVA